MAAPTLIIGLGGIGSRIIARVEALATGEQRKSLSFVAFDTDVNDLRSIREKGYTGHIVQTSSKLTVGEYLELDKQSRDNWFPVNNILCRKAVSEGAGQVRAISRLAFMSSIREGRMTELHEAIDSLYKLSGEATVQALRVIIVSTLAGGTGSGMLLPVALYLRDYLLTNYQLGASIVRGFFILPEVLYKVIPTESERNNLRCNAYATLRELDAFLMKGDGRLPEAYNNGLKLELPAIGSSGLRICDVMPYDFCFLFDGQNMDGGTLNTYEDYLSHAANCIFAQSIGPTAAKSNSSEDNVVLALVAEAGRNRYCGAGSAVIEYPYSDVRDFIAFNWAREKMGKQWLAADIAYKEKKKEEKDKIVKGIAVQEIDRGNEYVTFTSNYAKTDTFSKMVHDSCMVFDETQLEVLGGKWEDYIRVLEDFCDMHDIHRNQTIETKSGIILNKVQQAEQYDENNIRPIVQEIKAYVLTVKKILENAVTSMATSIFSGAKDMMKTESAQAFYLESALKSDGKEALHPNAIRFYLYNLRDALREKLEEYEKTCKDHQEYWETLDASLLGKGSRKTEAQPGHISKKKRELATKNKKRQLKAYMASVNDDEGYRRSYVKQEVFKAALTYVNALSEKYEIFYDNLEKNLEMLEYRIEELTQKYEIDSGKAIRYVCANKECLEFFERKLTSPAGLMELPSKFSNKIYSAIRDAMIESSSLDGQYTEYKEWHKNIFNNIILQFWRDTVEENCSTFIDMDVISAIKKEAEILVDEERKAADPNYREQYLIERAMEARKLATPFISLEQGIQQHVNETCTYNEELMSQFRVENRDKVLPNGISVKEDQLSKYKLLYYKAIYGKRANQIPKFAPAKESRTAPKDQGEYFRAYYERIQNIDPNAGFSKVITPHIDRRWHIVSELPDLDELNQQKQQRDIFMSMFYAFLYNYIQYEEYGNEKFKYVYKNEFDAFSDGSEAPSGSNTTEFIVSNNTTCDQYYEVLEALTINPIIVSDILRRVRKLHKKETDLRKPFSKSEFVKSLGELKIRSISKDKVRSLFELPVLYKMTSPVEQYNAEIADLLISAAMNFIRDNILWYADKNKADLYISRVIWEQYRLFEKNMKAFDEEEKEIYRGYMNDTVTNNIRRAVLDYYFEQADAEKQKEIKSHMSL